MKKIIILVVVVAILAVGYFVLKIKNPPIQIPSFTGGDNNNTNTGVEGSDLDSVTPQDIADEVDNLGSVDIDNELKDIDEDLNSL